MAKQHGNSVMSSTRGMFNKQVVFRHREGEVILAGPPKKRGNKKATPSQRDIQAAFKKAARYGRLVMEVPELKAAYKKVAAPLQSAYNVAFRDAYTPPVVEKIITIGYRGEVGDIIMIEAFDDFKVNNVRLEIFNAAGELIESGPCEVDFKESWKYTVTRENASVQGTKIKATAFDIPENEGTLEVIL
jgi:hypothetical protein